MSKEDPDKQRVRIIRKAWTDGAFKARLLSDPAATLKAEGFDLPAGREVRVLEDTAEVVHYVLPAMPGELTDAELDAVSGGRSSSTAGGMASTSIPRASGTPSPGSIQMEDIPFPDPPPGC